ncbi:TonB-dependent receptor [Novosphingobium mangrovi (ex Hu et al. 2023)]|uniref:TonB-dependent receptor n=1 Tax=Novosphingobium mangrovi (ex Hu et al. 2023) TaxID=2930094 RepID=A0ABT0AFB7_9SPHN|nr:TonB-dependent receptor [Novosphingobium mangrovi (ex Hu et al. 2023)]MCJ1961899.1 TonB-dependent receptor [Novosphingobium mangrovi (ex Hu et al. 2023)]
MNTRLQTKLSGASMMVVSALLGMGVAAPAQAQSETARSEGLAGSSIVVTARKREESLLETPIAITALSSDQIEKQGIRSINDVVLNTPGINVSNVNSGRNDRSFQQITLRGMTPSTTNSTLTASFIDGVPVASATALMGITDPERIEILKGPQNAYFGRNAFAGAINVVTKTPANSFGGNVRAMVGTRDNFDVQGSLEGQLVPGILGFRLTGRSMSKSGSYTNGANPNQTLGDQSSDIGTLQLEFTPTSQLTVKAFGMYSRDKDGPSAQGMASAYEVRSNNGSPNIPYFSGSNAGEVVIPGMANCTLAGRPWICGAVPKIDSRYSPAQNTTEDALLAGILGDDTNRITSHGKGVDGYGLSREYYHLHMNVDYELGDTGLTLSSLTGYNNEFYSEVADLDNYDSSAFTNFAATPANGLRTYWSFPYLVERRNKDFSQELRLSFDDGGPLQAMLGASYLYTSATPGLVSVSNFEQYGIPAPASARQPPQKARTYGIFGSLSYEITDALSINLEGRYQRDKIYAFAGGAGTNISPDAAEIYGLPAGSFPPLESFYNQTFNNFLPRIIINYDLTPDMMVYASWSKAANVSLSSFNTSFISGTQAEVEAGESIGLGVIVQPEKLDNYEVGFKGSFLNGRLVVTSAAYYATWKDQHNDRSVIFASGGQPLIVRGVANSGKSNVYGIELDVMAEPIDGFSITASGAWNGSSVRSFDNPAVTLRTGFEGDDFKGNTLPLTSEYSGNLALMYTGEVADWDDFSYFARGDLSYKSKQYVDPANQTWIKGRAQVNARIGFTKGDFTLEGFVTNLFNNKQYTSIAQNNLLEPSYLLASQSYAYLNLALPELRTWGLQASYNF